MTTQFLPESRVLLPRHPDITNTDDWPEFILDNATVSLPNTNYNDYISLLLAHENYPVRVTGRLTTPPSEDQAHLWRPALRVSTTTSSSRRRTPSHLDVELLDVRTFAYGAYPDGGVELWAAGRAGWFVLRPAHAYRKIYKEMVEAVNVMYFIVDTYKPEPRKRELPVEKFFKLYSREVAGDAKDAQALVYKHRDFLLSKMLEDREGIEWKTNPLFQHLCQKFGEDVVRIERRLAGKETSRKTKESREGRNGQLSPPTLTSTNGTLKRKRGVGAIAGPTEVATLDSTSESGKSQPPSRKTDRKKDVSNPRTTTPASSSTTSMALRRTRAASRLASESQSPDRSDRVATPPPHSDSESGFIISKTKSALRLKPRKPMKGLSLGAGKGGKGVKGPMEDDSDDDVDDVDDEDQASNEDEITPEIPQHESSRTTKRQTENPQPPPSHAKSSRRHDVDEGIDIPSSPSSATSTADPSTIPSNTHIEPDQLQEGTWVCALEGCGHQVYPSPSAQALIREHYALHAYDDDRRVRLVRNLQAPSLPVAHLLERVKMQARVDGFPASTVAGTRFPQELKTKY